LNRVKNGNFDGGRTGWVEVSTAGNTLLCTSTGCGAAVAPRSPRYLGWLGGDNNETAQISQRIALPPGQLLRLSFSYRIKSADSCGYDYGYVRLTADGVTRTLKTYGLCSTRNTPAWTNGQIDLSAYAGKTVTLIFRVATDATYVSNFFIDDVAIVNGLTCLNPAAPVSAESGPGVDTTFSAQDKPAWPAGAARSRQ
jgi:hypothetical protein